MNKLMASVALGAATLLSTAALAADPVKFDYPVYKDFVPPYIPPVDHGLKGSFYLRGSVAGNALWFKEGDHPTIPTTFDVDRLGYGYSYGAGVGYETGEGLRFDVTVDRIVNNDTRTTITGAPPLLDGDYTLELRSTLALANVYYDFGLSDLGLSAAGGTFGYVGAGAGVAYNDYIFTTGPAGSFSDTPGSNWTPAAAVMTGVGYDFGALVADLGYRGVYLHKIENTDAAAPYSLNNNFLHELRATIRYRF